MILQLHWTAKNSIRSSHGILLGPAAGCSLILGPVGLVHVCNLRYKWIIRVGIRQQWANWQKDLKTVELVQFSITKISPVYNLPMETWKLLFKPTYLKLGVSYRDNFYILNNPCSSTYKLPFLNTYLSPKCNLQFLGTLNGTTSFVMFNFSSLKWLPSTTCTISVLPHALI